MFECLEARSTKRFNTPWCKGQVRCGTPVRAEPARGAERGLDFYAWIGVLLSHGARETGGQLGGSGPRTCPGLRFRAWVSQGAPLRTWQWWWRRGSITKRFKSQFRSVHGRWGRPRHCGTRRRPRRKARAPCAHVPSSRSGGSPNAWGRKAGEQTRLQRPRKGCAGSRPDGHTTPGTPAPAHVSRAPVPRTPRVRPAGRRGFAVTGLGLRGQSFESWPPLKCVY